MHRPSYAPQTSLSVLVGLNYSSRSTWLYSQCDLDTPAIKEVGSMSAFLATALDVEHGEHDAL